MDIDKLLVNTHFPQLIFSKRNNFGNKLVAYWTDSNFSHVSICWGLGLIYDVRFSETVGFHGILELKNADWELCNFYRKLSKKEVFLLKKTWLSYLGKKYDLKSIFGFPFKTKRDKDAKVYCAELVEKGFLTINDPLVPRKPPERLTPELEYQSWKLYSVAKYNKENDKLIIF